MKWKFHHIALLVTSKLTSGSPLSQNVRRFTKCSFKLDSAEFSKEKARVLYFPWLFCDCVVEGSCGMINFDDIINLSVYCQDFFLSFIFQVSLKFLGTSYLLFLALQKISIIGPVLQVTSELVLEFIWIKVK